MLKLFWGAPSISAHFALQSSVLLAFMQATATSIGAKKKLTIWQPSSTGFFQASSRPFHNLNLHINLSGLRQGGCNQLLPYSHWSLSVMFGCWKTSIKASWAQSVGHSVQSLGEATTVIPTWRHFHPLSPPSWVELRVLPLLGPCKMPAAQQGFVLRYCRGRQGGTTCSVTK